MPRLYCHIHQHYCWWSARCCSRAHRLRRVGRRTGRVRRAGARGREGERRGGRRGARGAGQVWKTLPREPARARRPCTGRRSWPLAAGRWPLAAGRWPLAAGRWPLAAGRWPLAAGRWPLAAGRWPLAAGRWPLAAGRWPLAIISARSGGRCRAPGHEPGRSNRSAGRRRLRSHFQAPARTGGRPVSRHSQHGKPSPNFQGDPDARLFPAPGPGPPRRRSPSRRTVHGRENATSRRRKHPLQVNPSGDFQIFSSEQHETWNRGISDGGWRPPRAGARHNEDCGPGPRALVGVRGA